MAEDSLGPGRGTADSSNNSALDAAAKDADSNMSSHAVGDGVASCPSTASIPPATRISQEKTHWIAIELVDEEGKPVPDEDYRITLPDGSAVEGSLNSRGKDRIDGIDSGNCQITFPNLDKEMWS